MSDGTGHDRSSARADVPQAEPHAGTPMTNGRTGTLVSRKPCPEHCPGRERLAGQPVTTGLPTVAL